MRLIVNGEVYESMQCTLATLLEELQLDDAVVATALNGQFIAKDRRSTTPIYSGDRVEVLSPMQGG